MTNWDYMYIGLETQLSKLLRFQILTNYVPVGKVFCIIYMSLYLHHINLELKANIKCNQSDEDNGRNSETTLICQVEKEAQGSGQ